MLVTVAGLAIPCDLDLDGDVDLNDSAVLQTCLGEPNPSQHPTCWVADPNDSGSISRSDVVLFIDCLTGLGIPGDPNCPP